MAMMFSETLLIRGLFLIVPALLGLLLAVGVGRRAARGAPVAPPLGLGFFFLFGAVYLFAIAAALYAHGPSLPYLGLLVVAWAVLGYAMGRVSRALGSGQAATLTVMMALLTATHVFVVAAQDGQHIGGGDQFYHTPLIENVLSTHHAGHQLRSYEYYPVYHVMAAITAMCAGVGAGMGLAILALAVSVATICLVGGMLLCNPLTRPAAPYVAALASLGPAFLGFMIYFIPESYSFVFFILSLFVFVRLAGDVPGTLLLALCTIAWVATHQVTLIIASVLLLYVQTAYVLFVPRVAGEPRRSFWSFPVLVGVAALGYALFISLFIDQAIVPYFQSLNARFDPFNPTFAAASRITIENFLAAQTTAATFLITHLVHAVLLLLGVYMFAVAVLRPRGNGVSPWMTGFLFVFLLVALAYFPNPLWLIGFVDKNLNIVRWTLFMEIFVVLVAGFGFWHLSRRSFSLNVPMALALFMLGIALFAVTSDSAGSDVWLDQTRKEARPFVLSPAEMAGLTFLREERAPDELFSADFFQIWFVRGDHYSALGSNLRIEENHLLVTPTHGVLAMRYATATALEAKGVDVCRGRVSTVYSNHDIALFDIGHFSHCGSARLA